MRGHRSPRAAVATGALAVAALLAGCAAPRPAAPPAPPPPPVVVEGGAPRLARLPAPRPRHLAVVIPRGTPWRFDTRHDDARAPRGLARDSAGVAWPPAVAATAFPPVAALFLDTDSTVVVDSLVWWRLRATDDRLREPARLREAALLAADGDTVRADAVLADSTLSRSVWAYDALRRREALALARRDTLRADSLFANAVTRGWPDGDLAAWTAECARLAAARGDSARAVGLARGAVRRFPSIPATVTALRLLDTLLAVRGDSLDLADARAASDVDAFRGAPLAAAARLARVRDRTEGDERWRLRLRIAELDRRGRRWGEAAAASGEAMAFARDSLARSRVLLERARIHAAAARSDSALATYARAAALASEPATREAALWERAREFQDAGRWSDALRAFDRVTALHGSHRNESRFQAGLAAYVAGRDAEALVRWRDLDLDAARFWSGVLLRATGDERGDSLLARVAADPGYGFYAIAARDTLRRGGRADVVPAGPDPSRRFVARLRALASAGMDDDALVLAARWAARDPRLVSEAESPRALDHLASAEVAQRAGRPARVIAYAQRAQRDAESLPDSVQWAIVPWAFPPAYDSVLVATSDSARLEPALVRATMRQESVFDPQARSTSNALGLMQLLLPAAQDAARWGKEPQPTTEAPLLDPVTNLKWGVRYLARLIARFDGHVPVALSAYNAGASTIPPFWRDLIARGGDALFCEVASNADAQDYAKKILGYRAGYRELAPHVVP